MSYLFEVGGKLELGGKIFFFFLSKIIVVFFFFRVPPPHEGLSGKMCGKEVQRAAHGSV